LSHVTVARADTTQVGPDKSSILKLLNHTWGPCHREIILATSHLREDYWTYDRTKSVLRRDNPNKKTLIDIPNFVYSPSSPAEKLVWGGKIQQRVGCVCPE